MADTVMFIREDWTDFRNLATLGRRAGVPTPKIPRLVLKELVDNALDAYYASPAEELRYASCGPLPGGGYFVEDEGTGIPGTPEDVASLFSISRPFTSSKLLRLPTRGALGHGLRVVSGAVLASGGSLVVMT